MGSLQLDKTCLVAKLEIAGQSPGIQFTPENRITDEAAWFALMTAIRESAFFRQRFDILERGIETRIGRPDLKLAHSRRIHDKAAGRKQKKLSGGGGMQPAPGIRVRFPNFLR